MSCPSLIHQCARTATYIRHALTTLFLTYRKIYALDVHAHSLITLCRDRNTLQLRPYVIAARHEREIPHTKLLWMMASILYLAMTQFATTSMLAVQKLESVVFYVQLSIAMLSIAQYNLPTIV